MTRVTGPEDFLAASAVKREAEEDWGGGAGVISENAEISGISAPILLNITSGTGRRR